MAKTPKGNEVDLVVGEAELVPAPASPSTQHLAIGLSIVNGDTTSHPTVVLKKKGVAYTKVSPVVDLFPGTAMPPIDPVTLDATDESLVVQMTGAIAVTAPRADVSYVECTP